MVLHMDLGTQAMQMLWLGALAATPLAIVAGLVCLVRGSRPATKHAIWAAVLTSFLTPTVAAVVWRPSWFGTGSVMRAAQDVLGTAEDANTAPVVHRVMAPARPTIKQPSTLWIMPPAVGSSRRDGSAPTPSLKLSDLAGTAPAANAGDTASSARMLREVPSSPRGALSLAAQLFSQYVSHKAAASPIAEPETCIASMMPIGTDADGCGTPVCVQSCKESERPAPSLCVPIESGPIASPSNLELATTKPGSESASSVQPIGTMQPISGLKLPIDTGTLSGRAEAVESATAESQTLALTAWLGQALRLRDAVAAMPPIPSAIWLGGACVILIVWCVRWLSLRRIIRSGHAASDDVVEMVAASAQQVRLRRIPETVMVDVRVSPMIGCGLRPRLVLPAELWEELDDQSRRAVIYHELAHLKRRDHWVCVLEGVVSLLYWWHPVAWWVRRRVHDEADASCDAWVTSLLPTSRRAYAEALVVTKSYLSMPGRRVPVGLGVMSGRTKRLARRLKMVMTQKVTPKASVFGTIVAAGVLAAGMFVMPGLACPPEELARIQAAEDLARAKVKDATSAAAKAEKDRERYVRGMAASNAAPAAPAVEFFGEAPALEAMRATEAARAGAMRAETFARDAARERAAAQNDGDRSIQRLEERLRRLEQQLRELESLNRSGGSSFNPVQAPIAVAGTNLFSSGSAPSFTTSAPARAVTGYPVIATAPAGGMGGPAVVQGYAIGSPAGGFGLATTDAGVETVREYRLPEGKLRAMIALMEREDVPVFIDRYSDKVAVHGTEAQHRVFAAFVEMIHPSVAVKGEGISTSPAMGGTPVIGRLHTTTDPVAKPAKAGNKAAAEQLQKTLKELEKQRNNLEKQAEKLRSRSDAFRERGEKAQEQASEAGNELSDVTTPEQDRRIRTRMEQLVKQAEQLEVQAAQLEQQASQIEAEGEKLEARAEEIQARLEQLEVQADEDDDAESRTAVTTGDPLAAIAPKTTDPTWIATPKPAPTAVTTSRAPSSAPIPPAGPLGSVGPIAPVPPVAPVPSVTPMAPIAPVSPVAPAAPAAAPTPMPGSAASPARP